MLIVQIKEGEILQVGEARIAWVTRPNSKTTQIRIAVEADKSIKVIRTKEFIDQRLRDLSDEKSKYVAESKAKRPCRSFNNAPRGPVEVIKKRSR